MEEAGDRRSRLGKGIVDPTLGGLASAIAEGATGWGGILARRTTATSWWRPERPSVAAGLTSVAPGAGQGTAAKRGRTAKNSALPSARAAARPGPGGFLGEGC